jgi:alcohol dehydrogenase (cytochrome c)
MRLYAKSILGQVTVGLTMTGILAVIGCQSERPAGSDAEWLSYNKGYDGQRYSPLEQIDARNVQSLVQACALKIADAGAFQAGPLVIDGMMIVTTARSTVALDATNCTQRWRNDYTPEAPEAAAVNRGVAYLGGHLFRGTGDGRLLALDAATGKTLWKVVVTDPTKGESLTSAPIAWGGLVFIGTTGGDFGVRGRMMAFDAATGREAWRFDTIPTGHEAGAETWQVADTALKGGGAMWSSYTLDVTTGELFVPVGNPAPDLNPAYRPGQNLYTDSLVVLDARTGALKWWYQLKTDDGADHDLAAAPLLYRNSKGDALVAMAGKDGYVHVVDRNTHRLAFRTAVTTIRNEDVAPTEAGLMVCPGMGGGTKWNGPAFDPTRKTLFVAATDWCSLLKRAAPAYVAGRPYWGGSFMFDKTPGAANGWVTALDSDTGAVRWRYHTGSIMAAAVTPTAGGLLFTGTAKGELLALDSASGAVLFRASMPGGLAGGIITYQIGGRQFVAFTSGNISRSTNELPGSPTLVIMSLPDPEHPATQPPGGAAARPAQAVTRPGDAAPGKALYVQTCINCHGQDGTMVAGHSLKSMKDRMAQAQIVDKIKNPVAPMPRLFPAPFGAQDVEDLAAYVRSL